MTEEMVEALRNFESCADFSLRERLALRFAERMAMDHHQIDDGFFSALRREFSAAEIIELGLLTGLFLGYGRLIAALDLETPGGGEVE